MAELPEAIVEEENEFSEESKSMNLQENSVSVSDDMDSRDNLVHVQNIYGMEEEKEIPF